MVPRRVAIDESCFPLVVVTWPVDPMETDVDEFCRSELALLARQLPFVRIIDARARWLVTFQQRQRFVRHGAEASDVQARFCKGTAFVMDNPLIRGGLAAVIGQSGVAYPFAVVTTFEEARARCDAWARDAGLVIPVPRLLPESEKANVGRLVDRT